MITKITTIKISKIQLKTLIKIPMKFLVTINQKLTIINQEPKKKNIRKKEKTKNNYLTQQTTNIINIIKKMIATKIKKAKTQMVVFLKFSFLF